MRSVTQAFTIGFYDSSGVFSIYAKKDDVGRALKFHLADGTNDYSEILSDPNLIICVREILPSGFNLPDVPVDIGNVNVEEQSVVVPLTKEMLQESGTAECEVVFSSGLDHKILSTTPFKLIIQDAFNRRESATDIMFDTWTELYIEIKTVEQTLAGSLVFNGTVAVWNALSPEDKANYKTVILLDD